MKRFSSYRLLVSLVNTHQAGQGQLKVELASPPSNSTPCGCYVQETNPQEYRVSFTPIEPGRYQLRLFFNNQLIHGKPIEVDVLTVPQKGSTPSASLVRLQKLHPSVVPEVGDEICLQGTRKNYMRTRRIDFLLDSPF